MRGTALRQSQPQRLLGRCLADRARDGDDARPGAGPRRDAEPLQRGKHLAHDIERPQMRQRIGMGLVDDRGEGALGEGARDIIMAVVIGAADGDKKIALLQRSRIDRDARGAARRDAPADARLKRLDEPEAGP